MPQWEAAGAVQSEEKVKGGPDRCFWLYGRRRKQILSLYMPKKNERQQKQVTTNGWKFQLGIRNFFSDKDVQTLEQIVVESSLLEILQTCLGAALPNL